MFTRTVKILLNLGDGSAPIEVRVSIACTPKTPDTVVIRRAGNIFQAAANNARYEVIA